MFITGDMNWYLGTEHLPDYFQLTENMVVTHNDTLHVEMSRSCYEEVPPHIQHPWSLLKANEGETENLIIMCTDATFLLDRMFLSHVSDTL